MVVVRALKASLLHIAGYRLPDNFTIKGAWLVGVINSVGLTVALFVCGEAYRDDLEIQGEAKLGAMLSILGSLFAILLSFVVDTSIVPVEMDNSIDIDVDTDEDEEFLEEQIAVCSTFITRHG